MQTQTGTRLRAWPKPGKYISEIQDTGMLCYGVTVTITTITTEADARVEEHARVV